MKQTINTTNKQINKQTKVLKIVGETPFKMRSLHSLSHCNFRSLAVAGSGELGGENQLPN